MTRKDDKTMPHDLGRTIGRVKWSWLPTFLIISLMLAACGGGGSAPAAANEGAGSDQVAVPTMPSARFTAVAEQGAFTDTVGVTQTQSVQVNAPDLERGARAYERNKCADCHGANGEGVADKGKAIAGTTLSAAEFEQILRTGGGLGNTHIFGPSAVSPTGMETLYAYVQSLQQ
jgi:mono/diheme cytochrome c family protein